jgi:hypothetical protein
MKWWPTILGVLALGGLVVLVILPGLARAKRFSGPGIAGNLRYIQVAKEQWIIDGHTNEWPTANDLFPGSSKTFQEIIRSRYGEPYFINRTGAPPFVYFPKAVRQYGAGEILVLSSNGLTRVRQ